MEYCGINDLTRWIDPGELIALCSREAGATLQSPEVTNVANEVIKSAGSEIDGYLLGRYPGLRGITPTPTEIQTVCARIAIYYLYLRRRAMNVFWRQQYEDCRERLEKMSRGELDLSTGEPLNKALASGNAWRTDAGEDDSAYSRDKLNRF